MSQTFGPFTISPGLLSPIIIGQFPDVDTAVFLNLSPYTLRVDPGNGNYPAIAPGTQDKIILGNQFSGTIRITAKADVSFLGNAPATALYIIGYRQGEPIPGVYPSALSGGLVTVGMPTPPILFTVDTTTQDQTVFDFQNKALGSKEFLFRQATLGVEFMDAQSLYFPLVLSSSGGNTMDNGTWATDGSGNTSATSYKTRASIQETGFCGADGQASAANQFIGQGVNFKTVMSNVPTSITLSAVLHSNDQATSAGTISKNGFIFTTESVAGGRVFNYGTYTTVGN